MAVSDWFTGLGVLLRRAAWAPIAVVIAHAIIERTTLRVVLDFWIHFSGGAAIAYFLFVAIETLQQSVGRVTVAAQTLFAFALACTVGLFWEFGELASDVFLGTHIQKDLRNTMSDLIADASGAVLALGVVAVVRRIRA